MWSFQTGYVKLERFLPKNQHTQRKFLNFENWTNYYLPLFQVICMVCSIKIIQLPLSLLESLQSLVLFSCVWSIGWKPQQQTLAALSMSVLKSLTKMNWNVATPHHQWFRVWLQQQLCQLKVIYCLNLNLF